MLGNFLRRGARLLRRWTGSQTRHGMRTGNHPEFAQADARRLSRESSPLNQSQNIISERFSIIDNFRSIQREVNAFIGSKDIAKLIEAIPQMKSQATLALQQSETLLKNAEECLKKLRIVRNNISPEKKAQMDALIENFKEVVATSKRIKANASSTKSFLDDLAQIENWDNARRLNSIPEIETLALRATHGFEDSYGEMLSLSPAVTSLRLKWLEIFPHSAPLSLLPFTFDEEQGITFSDVAWGAFDTVCLGLEAGEAIGTGGLSIAYNYAIDKAVETATPVVVPLAVEAGKQIIEGAKHAIQGSKRVTEAFTIAGKLGTQASKPDTWGIPGISNLP